ncbi:MAG TPA: polysaccharide pyruvyl transferase family protein [Flavobacteriaceae bacterium]|nr:polysaccharide pyruvyl transferase family protein [Flavobacteriaceae bacterium]
MDLKKKIGVITFHFPLNYGALLQTFALYKYLQNQGHDVEIINYCPPQHMAKYDFYQKPQSLKNLLYYLIKSVFIFKYISKKKKFKTFRQTYLNESDLFLEGGEIVYEYEIVLTGSDQVFNLKDGKVRLPYFQPFIKASHQRKVAYAPSFGTNIFSRELEKTIKKYIKDFDLISCREPDGTSFLQSLTTLEVKHVVDPVFLLSTAEWESYSAERMISDDYIFVYDLNGKKPLIDIAKLNKKHEKIVLLSNDPIARLRREYKDVDVFIESAGVEEFLSLIRFSKGVVTDSFHGVAFSFILEIPLLTFIALEEVGSRIKTFLTVVGRDDLLVTKLDIRKGDAIFQCVKRNEILEEWIKRSKQFLEKLSDG